MIRSDKSDTECDIDSRNIFNILHRGNKKINKMDDLDYVPMDFPTVLQWNVQGVVNKKEELRLLKKSLKPVMFCLQETKLSPERDITDYLKNYSVYRNDFLGGLIACGGVATLVKKSVYSEQIPLNTSLQAIGVKIKLNWLSYDVSVCNVYIPSDGGFQEKDITDLVSQLPKPCILCGDFNSHSKLWNAKKANVNGLEIEDFLHKNYEMFLLNGDEITHVNSSYRTLSTLDLTFVSSSIANEVTWLVYEDVCYSDHHPVLLKIHSHHENNVQYSYRDIWMYKKADWLKYQQEIDFHEKIKLLEHTDIDVIIQQVNDNILKAAKSAIPKVNFSRVPRMVPWWNEVVQQAFKERREALRQYKNDRSLENFINYKRKKAKARYEIRASKKGSWMLFVDSINEPVNESEMWKKIQRFKGKKKSDPISALKTEDGTITIEKKEITEILARNYVKNSADEQYAKDFRMNRRKLELSMIGPALNTEEEYYNLPFIPLTSCYGPSQPANLQPLG